MAWWVARVTLAANQWGPLGLRDSESAARRSGPRELRRLRRRAPPEDIPPALGGHTVVRAASSCARPWLCVVCRCSARRRDTLATTRCRGSAVVRWARRATEAAERGEALGCDHQLLLTGLLVWCFRCGANTCTRAVNLAKPCPRRVTAFLAQARQRLLLGLHPSTRVPLVGATAPEPGAAWPPGYTAALAAAQASCTRAAASPPRRRGPPGVARDSPAPPASVPAAAPPEPAWRAAMRARLAERQARAARAAAGPSQAAVAGADYSSAPAPKRCRLAE
jgi:hypothetical protein